MRTLLMTESRCITSGGIFLYLKLKRLQKKDKAIMIKDNNFGARHFVINDYEKFYGTDIFKCKEVPYGKK